MYDIHWRWAISIDNKKPSQTNYFFCSLGRKEIEEKQDLIRECQTYFILILISFFTQINKSHCYLNS